MVLASQGAMAAPYPADGHPLLIQRRGFINPSAVYPYGGPGALAVGPTTQVSGDCSGQYGPDGVVSGVVSGVGNIASGLLGGGYGNNCGIPGVGGGLVPGVLGGGVPYNGGGGLI